MFRTGSPYSPFFTSGLLSPPSARASSVILPHESFTPSLRTRRSRDSLRSIPSPKPVPSITLPDIPSPISSAPPRLPSIVISPSLGISLERASYSAPSLVISRTKVPFDVPDRNSISTVSTSVRKVNRSHALARLEGRTNSTRRRPRTAPLKPAKRNFMCMTDDDSDDDFDDYQDRRRRVTFNVINEPEDLVLPPPIFAPLPLYAKTAPITGRFPSLSPTRNLKRTTEWFPLKSFIDFQSGADDDTTRWSWRSFIQSPSVS
ncbi:hypothetical protein H0H92_004639 [Tricholoma furcatifolium]|nr:hypothetical protein H0H92_004639 [Tricholoma furcatifolium]